MNRIKMVTQNRYSFSANGLTRRAGPTTAFARPNAVVGPALLVVDSDGGDRLSLSHVEETACTSRSSGSASVKAAGAFHCRFHILEV